MPYLCLTLLVIAAGLASAHDLITTKLTWSAEISRIVLKRCAGCHKEGGTAPMPLTAYEGVRPWAKAIRDEVLSRRMPPWGAVKGFGEFEGDPSLTQDEITRIAEWAEGGAPEGDPRYLPFPVPQPPHDPPVPYGVRSRTLTTAKSTMVLGIRPLVDAGTAKVVALAPDGSVEPMLWLLSYRAASQRTFVYRQPLVFPAGTQIHSPVPVELLIRPPAPAR